MKKIACLFPGIGYTCDKPLLYYSWKLLKSEGWEILPLQYSGFPSGVKGNEKKMRQAAEMALAQAEKQLQDRNWSEYKEILFIGKSVGTVVCTAYAKQHRLKCRQILFTPVEGAFQFMDQEEQAEQAEKADQTNQCIIAFHGTADPWADTEEIKKACEKRNIPLYLTENANHSLETGDVDKDLKEMRKVMETVKNFVTEGEKE